MNDKHFLGRRVSSVELYDEVGPITAVALLVDAENEILVGDDKGYTLEIECPYGTEAMAENILAQVNGETYKGFRAHGAALDPTAELGDGITVDGTYSFLAYRSVNFGPGHMSEIAAPGENVLDHEYQYKSPIQRQERRNAQTTATIAKTSEKISLDVRSVEEGLKNYATKESLEKYSTIEMTNESIMLEVGRLEETFDGRLSNYSTIKQTANSINMAVRGLINGEDARSLIDVALGEITMEVSSSEGSSTFVLKAGSAELTAQTLDLTVDAVNITGTLKANQIDAGAITADKIATGVIPTKVSQLTNDEGYKTKTGVVSIIEGTVDADYVYALGIEASSIRGSVIGIMNATGNTTATITPGKTTGAGFALETNGTLFFHGGDNLQLHSDENITVSCGDGYNFYPDGYQPNLGLSTNKWDTLYANACSASTSDRNKKHDIEELPGKYIKMLDAIVPKRFKLNGGTSGRYHIGFIAQDVEAAMLDNDVSSSEFGGWIKDVDKNGDDVYMLRYEEFIGILLAKIRQQEERLKKLEAKA